MADLTQAERDALLAEYQQLRDKLRNGYELSVDDRRVLDKKSDAVLDEYVSRLPQVPIGRCAVNGELSLKRMDLFGFDGKWWQKNCPDLPAQSCGHFVTYTGALRLNGEVPPGCSPKAIHEIHPGPEAPFVIPQLLEIRDVSCVISSRTLMKQYPAYFMAYYSPKPIPGMQSHQPWLRGSYSFVGLQGQTNWYASNAVWDFDLDAWRRKPGKIFWVAPDDDTMTLQMGASRDFPYSDLPGARRPQVIRQGKIYLLPAPDGSRIEPSD
jgi:hypothetical protein